MKICIVGNSHIATLNRAWDDGLSMLNPQHTITFFGAVRDKIMGLRPEGGCLVANDADLAASIKFTSGGFCQIDIAAFDAVLVFGLCRKIHELVEVMGASFSSGLKEQAITDYWKGRNLARLVSRIPKLGNCRIYAGHSPLEASAGDGPSGLGCYPDFIELSNRFVFSKLGATLLPQPVATIVGGNATARRFSKGSLKLAVDKGWQRTHSDEEICHMNADFGRLWLQDFLLGLEPPK